MTTREDGGQAPIVLGYTKGKINPKKGDLFTYVAKKAT